MPKWTLTFDMRMVGGSRPSTATSWHPASSIAVRFFKRPGFVADRLSRNDGRRRLFVRGDDADHRVLLPGGPRWSHSGVNQNSHGQRPTGISGESVHRPNRLHRRGGPERQLELGSGNRSVQSGCCGDHDRRPGRYRPDHELRAVGTVTLCGQPVRG